MYANDQQGKAGGWNEASNNANNHGEDDGIKPFLDIAEANFDSRANFIKKVYITLSVQLAVTTAIATSIWLGTSDFTRGANAPTPEWVFILMWISLSVYLVCLCSLCCCAEYFRRTPQNYIFISMLTLAMSVLIGFVVSAYNAEDVIVSAGITMAIVVSLSLFAVVVKTDFTGFGPYLFAAFMVLFCFSLVVGLLNVTAFKKGGGIRWLRVAINVGAVILFSFILIFDTQMIVGGKNRKYTYSSEDFVFAAISLYLDIINIFLYILALFGDN